MVVPECIPMIISGSPNLLFLEVIPWQVFVPITLQLISSFFDCIKAHN